MDNHEIKITHFVNPHFFFFKWIRDEGFVEDLNILENKIKSIAKGDENSSEVNQASESGTEVNSEVSTNCTIKITDVVGAFVPDWHKWIRVSIKKKESDGRFCVWANDYGIPMVVNASNIIRLPRSFAGMHLKKKRIHVGGIDNCYPASIKYDISIASTFKEKKLNWSIEAIGMTRDLLNKSVKLCLEDTQDLRPLKRSHFFGRLMMQSQDGSMVNVLKCLLETNQAALTESAFIDELKTIETLQQPYWLSIDGNSLDTKLSTSPLIIVNETTGYTDKEYFDDETVVDPNESPCIEDNEFFDESVSVFQPREQIPFIDFQDQQEKPASQNQPNENSSSAMVKKVEGSIEKKPILNQPLPKTSTNSQVSSSIQTTSSADTSQQDSAQKLNFNHNHNQKGNTYNSGGRKYRNRRPNRENQFQGQRGGAQTNQMNWPPNQFEQMRNPIQPPMSFNQQPNHFNHRKGEYVPPHMRTKRQDQGNKKNSSRKEFGSAEFNENVGKRRLDSIQEQAQNGPMDQPNLMSRQKYMPRFNILMNTPPHFQAFSYPLASPMIYHQRNPNERNNNNYQRNRQRNSGFEANRNNTPKKLSGHSEGIPKLDGIESMTKEMEIKNEPVEHGTEASNEKPENVMVETKPDGDEPTE